MEPDIAQTSDEATHLLAKTQEVMLVEKALSLSLEKVEPWIVCLRPSPLSPPLQARVRPLPSNLREAEHILAIARNLGSRTAAPAGWNPVAPVIGFSTPNPMPHMLRGGALAALQLKHAKKSDADKQKKRKLFQQEKEQQDAIKSEATSSKEYDATVPVDAKRADLREHKQQQQQLNEQQQHRRSQKSKWLPERQEVSMNLSDSSSEDEER